MQLSLFSLYSGSWAWQNEVRWKDGKGGTRERDEEKINKEKFSFEHLV